MLTPDSKNENAGAVRLRHSQNSRDLGQARYANISPFDLFVQRLTEFHGRPPFVRGRKMRGDCTQGHSSRHTMSAVEGENGSLCFHCFACRDKQAILRDLSLSFSDLYPQRLKDSTPEGRRAVRQSLKEASMLAAWNALAAEVTVVRIVAGDVLRQDVTAQDLERCALAERHINDAISVLNGR